MDSDRLEKRKADEEQPHPRITRGGSKSRMCLYVLNSCCLLYTSIQRGYVTTDDLEELEELNKPYKALGGNGTVKTALEKVKQLPLK